MIPILRSVLLVALAIAAVCAVIGAVVAYVRSESYIESIGYAMAIGGAAVLLVVAAAGSPGQRAADSRQVVGGRFVEGSDRAQPESLFVAIPASIIVIAVGVLVHVLAA